MNAFSLIALVFGTILAVLGFLTPVVKINSFEMGIIGGADAPTYLTLLFGDYDGLLIAVALLGVALLVTALACMFFEKSVGTHCSLATSALSLGLGAGVAYSIYNIISKIGMMKGYNSLSASMYGFIFMGAASACFVFPAEMADKAMANPTATVPSAIGIVLILVAVYMLGKGGESESEKNETSVEQK